MQDESLILNLKKIKKEKELEIFKINYLTLIFLK
jgi:hypothetical protein